jgi:electron transport complex protein RnfG
MVLAVLVTCAVSASALTVTYGATKDLIAEQERIAREEALREVLGEFELLQEFDEGVLECINDSLDDATVSAVYVALDADAALVGYGVLTEPRGYGGPMAMAVGVDRDGLVTGASIISHKETPGLGTKVITEEYFLEQFVGWVSDEVDSSDQGYDAIAGATKSSTAVRKGVQTAEHAYLVFGECGGGVGGE